MKTNSVFLRTLVLVFLLAVTFSTYSQSVKTQKRPKKSENGLFSKNSNSRGLQIFSKRNNHCHRKAAKFNQKTGLYGKRKKQPSYIAYCNSTTTKRARKRAVRRSR